MVGSSAPTVGDYSYYDSQYLGFRSSKFDHLDVKPWFRNASPATSISLITPSHPTARLPSCREYHGSPMLAIRVGCYFLATGHCPELSDTTQLEGERLKSYPAPEHYSADNLKETYVES